MAQARPERRPGEAAHWPRHDACFRRPDRAWAELGKHALYQSQNYARWFGAACQPIGPVLGSVDQLRQRNPNIFLTPEQAVERLRGLAERAHAVLPEAEMHFYWWSVFPGEPVESATRGLELAAKKVLPALRES